MTWQETRNAIRAAVSFASRLPLEQVRWGDESTGGEWAIFPRVRLFPAGMRVYGLAETRYQWDDTNDLLRAQVFSVDLVRIRLQVECERVSDGSGALAQPAARIAKILRTNEVDELLRAGAATLQGVNEFGAVDVEIDNRDLSVSVVEIILQVNNPEDITPENGVDWFNRVEIRGTVDGTAAPTQTIGPAPFPPTPEE